MLEQLFPNLNRPLVALAPMAGVTDPAMRAACLAFGADVTVSEMVSAKALTMGDKKSRRLLKKGGHGGVYGVQLFAAQPDIAAEAAGLIADEDFDFIDLNMGCPAPKITGGGCGSGLLLNPGLGGEIAAAVVKASGRPVSVKLRIGWDDARMTGLELAKYCEAAGVKQLCVHSRTRKEQYGPVFHPEEVSAIRQAVAIPVIYNGNVVSGQSAGALLGQTGCAGVAVGRAAMGSPWLFREIVHFLETGESLPEPPLSQKLAVLDRQVRAMCDWYGEENAMRMARGVAAQYMKGLKGAATLRRQAVAMHRYMDLARLMDRVYQEQARREPQEGPAPLA